MGLTPSRTRRRLLSNEVIDAIERSASTGKRVKCSPALQVPALDKVLLSELADERLVVESHVIAESDTRLLAGCAVHADPGHRDRQRRAALDAAGSEFVG